MNKKMRLIFVLSVLVLLLAGMNSQVVQAHNDPNQYGYLIGESSSTVPLCKLGATACPDVGMAQDGQFIEITGSGALNIRTWSVTGGGNYTHHFLDGSTVNGIWTAKKLLRFDEDDCEVRKILGLVCTGKAVIQVHIVADGGLFEGDGILYVNSLAGGDSSKGTGDTRLDVPGIVTFNKAVSGKAVFYPSH